jgi:hypothetical protein
MVQLRSIVAVETFPLAHAIMIKRGQIQSRSRSRNSASKQLALLAMAPNTGCTWSGERAMTSISRLPPPVGVRQTTFP